APRPRARPWPQVFGPGAPRVRCSRSDPSSCRGRAGRSPESRGSARTGRRPSGAVFGGYGIDSCCQANPDRKDCQGCLDSEAVWPLLVTRPHQTEGFGYGPTMPITPPPSSRPWQNRAKIHALQVQGRFAGSRRGLSWGVLLAGALAAAVALWGGGQDKPESGNGLVSDLDPR